MNGALVVDKPVGPTSHDVVARVRRATGIKRIGHTGTLDPAATGVLVLVLGRATRLARFLSSAEKAYDARIRLGAGSDTYDASGRVAAASGPVPGREVIVEALAGFVGLQLQSPPPYSAKKVGGVRAYTLARRKTPVEPPPVAVTVHALEVLDVAGTRVDLHVVCSAGFYLRSLAHDLGNRLGCGGYLESLRRTRSGDFTGAQAVQLETIERDGVEALQHLIPLNDLLPGIPGIVLTERGARRVAHGNAITQADVAADLPALAAPAPMAPTAVAAEMVRLLDGTGTLLGIAERAGGRLLHPVVVLV